MAKNGDIPAEIKKKNFIAKIKKLFSSHAAPVV